VVIGGLLMSTLLDQIVTPALFFKFGRKVYEKVGEEEDAETSGWSRRAMYGACLFPKLFSLQSYGSHSTPKVDRGGPGTSATEAPSSYTQAAAIGRGSATMPA
jgi:hypothetical protein